MFLKPPCGAGSQRALNIMDTELEFAASACHLSNPRMTIDARTN